MEWLWLWVPLVVLAVDDLRRDQSERVVSENNVGVQGVFLGLRDLCVGVHVRPFIWAVTRRVVEELDVLCGGGRVRSGIVVLFREFFRGQW